jgi:hypothetical protein
LEQSVIERSLEANKAGKRMTVEIHGGGRY